MSVDTRARERVGVLGGTFDPVHVGHIVAAVEVRHALSLDRCLMVVANDPWQKEGEVVAAADDRLAMVDAATEGLEGIESSDVEVRRGGPSYTAQTIDELRSPNRSLFLVVGADVAATLETWKDVDTLRDRVTLVIVDRRGDPGTSPPGDWQVERVTIPRIDISSTELRGRLRDGRPVAGLMPPGAIRVAQRRRLYTPAQWTASSSPGRSGS